MTLPTVSKCVKVCLNTPNPPPSPLTQGHAALAEGSKAAPPHPHTPCWCAALMVLVTTSESSVTLAQSTVRGPRSPEAPQSLLAMNSWCSCPLGSSPQHARTQHCKHTAGGGGGGGASWCMR